jgi:hypothetical protein
MKKQEFTLTELAKRNKVCKATMGKLLRMAGWETKRGRGTLVYSLEAEKDAIAMKPTRGRPRLQETV